MPARFWSALSRLRWWLVPPLFVFAAGATWFAFDPGFKEIGSGGADAPASGAFEQRVHDYLLKNPQVIIESLQAFEERTRAAEESEGRKALKSHADEVFHDPATPVGGNPAGDVTMVEFFDYNCPYCRKVESVVLETEAADPKLRIVYKEFPILGPNSVFAAKAALAANRQGRYVAFHKAMMQVHGPADQTSTLRVAADVGLDVAKLRTDMADPAIQATIDRNLALAQALRIAGTPGFVIGNRILRGATDAATMRNLIAEARTGPSP